MKILTRPSKPKDLSLVFDSWLNSWRTSKYAGTIPNHKFYEVQRAAIEDLFARGMQVMVAHPEGHENLIMGWIAYERKPVVYDVPPPGASIEYTTAISTPTRSKAEFTPVIHYAFIKDAYLESDALDLLIAAVSEGRVGMVTHRLPYTALRKWAHTPEVARRKSL